MHLEFSPSQDALRAELREYFAKLMSPEVKAEIGASHDYGEARRSIMRKMGADGWLGIGWPKEYGGQGRSEIEQFIFFEEAQRVDAPVPFVTLNTVGPTLIQYGSEAHKKKYLPGILSGDLAFAIGYSEAEAGTDLASLSTKAVRDGDEWLINGAKMWTSGAVGADYIWLACRTDPDVKKHKGISIIIVPTDTPGFSVTPIVTVGSSTTTATYYDDVRVPYENLVSDLNSGWRLITTQLNHERIGLAAVSSKAYRVFDDCLAWAKETDSGDGTPMIEVPWVAASFGACHARLEAMRTMNQQMAADVRDQKLTPAKASSSKVMGTETLIEVYKKLLEVVGAAGPIRAGSPAAILMGDLEDQGRTAQINTFGGGVNEVQREIIAWMGLGMTRTSR